MTDPAEVISFERALELTKGIKRDLLLGNGFSIAAHDAFDYRKLLERAGVPDDVMSIFVSARTANFEAVMRILLSESMGASPRQAQEKQEKIEALKSALIDSIHEVHPSRKSEICAPRWAKCEDFLEHFIGRRIGGRIFTTNYDLLLSWAVAPDRERPLPQKRFKAYEGFRGGTYDSCGSSTIIYLHGALHLYREGLQERQRQYWKTGIPLHDQIAEALARGEYPMVVTEGASVLKKPTSPGFLHDALKAFNGTCKPAKTERKALFTLGHGLGPEDAHILGKIPEGSIPTVCLGAYNQSEAQAFRRTADLWIARRAETRKPLTVYIFNSKDVVWGPSP